MKRLYRLLTVILTLGLLLTTVYAETNSPTANSPTTESPGADSPGTDSPGTDSPGTDSPGTDSPGADSPTNPDVTGDLTVYQLSQSEGATYASQAEAALNLDGYVAGDALRITFKTSESETEVITKDTVVGLKALVTVAEKPVVVAHKKADGTWMIIPATNNGAGRIAFTVAKEDGLGIFIVYQLADVSVSSKNESQLVVNNSEGFIIVKNFKSFPAQDSTVENLESLVNVKNAVSMTNSSANQSLVQTKAKVSWKGAYGDSVTYTVIVVGDVNCDGRVDSRDYVAIKNHIMEDAIITDGYIKIAADANFDGEIHADDYVEIKNYIMSL